MTQTGIDEMFDLMQKYGGLGPAAPQVGIDARNKVACGSSIRFSFVAARPTSC